MKKFYNLGAKILCSLNALNVSIHVCYHRNGRVLEGCWIDPNRRHCVVSFSKNRYTLLYIVSNKDACFTYADPEGWGTAAVGNPSPEKSQKYRVS